MPYRVHVQYISYCVDLVTCNFEVVGMLSCESCNILLGVILGDSHNYLDVYTWQVMKEL